MNWLYSFENKQKIICKQIFRMGQPAYNDISEVYEETIYLGSENPFIYSRTYNLECHCQFNLVNFPFDSQQCEIIVRVTKRSTKNLYQN